MNRAELCQAIADDADNLLISPALVDRVLRSFAYALGAALASGEEVHIKGDLGRFDAVKVRAHLGRNPATGEDVEVPEKRKIRFRPSAGLRAAVGGPAMTAP